MGGIILIAAALVGYLMAHALTQNSLTISAVLVLGLVIALGLLGFIDDWLKVSRQKSLGLTGRQKLIGQASVAAIFGTLGVRFADSTSLTPISYYLSGVRETAFYLGPVLAVAWVVLMVMSASNGVNLADGLDGLATGAAVMVFLAFILIGVWEFGQGCSINAGVGCYQVRDPLDLAVLAAAFAGSCTGFLWWNASPAKIFMGDTGSLALGGMLGTIAVATKHEIVLAIVGGLFVVEALSVIIQVASFKLTGKRVFRMAPIHHHFEKLGWSEPQVVVRFWIIAVVFALAGLATLKLR
jgi:phospho-N-acetylmuramoyl-pentapeptide-transferase